MRTNMKTGTTTTPENERVPTKLIADLINRWLVEHKANSPSESGHPSSYIEGNRKDEHLGILTFHCGVSIRHLRRILSGKTHVGQHRIGTYKEVGWVSFDIADKIVCGTVGPLAWHVEPLSEFYGPLSVKTYERGYEHLEEAA